MRILAISPSEHQSSSSVPVALRASFVWYPSSRLSSSLQPLQMGNRKLLEWKQTSRRSIMLQEDPSHGQSPEQLYLIIQRIATARSSPGTRPRGARRIRSSPFPPSAPHPKPRPTPPQDRTRKLPRPRPPSRRLGQLPPGSAGPCCAIFA